MPGVDALVEEPTMTQADHARIPRNKDFISSPSFQQTGFTPSERSANSSSFHPSGSDHEADTENQNGSLLRCTTSVVTQQNRVLLGDNLSTVETNDDAKVLGRRLFEEDRKSRISSIVKIQEDLMKKGMPKKVYVLGDRKGSSSETSENNKSSVEGNSFDDTPRDYSGNSDLLSYDTKKVLNSDESGKGSLSSEEVAVASSEENVQAHDEDRKSNVLTTSSEVKKDDLTDLSSATTETERVCEPEEIRQEKKEDKLTRTEQVNSTPNCSFESDLLTKATVMSQSKSGTQFSDGSQILENQKRSGPQSVKMIPAQGVVSHTMEKYICGEEAGEDFSTEERCAKNDSRNSTPGKERVSEVSMGQTCASHLPKTSTSPSRDVSGDKNFTKGGWDQFLSLWNAENDEKENNDSKAIEENVEHLDGWLQSMPKTKNTSPQSFQGGEVVVDGGMTYDEPTVTSTSLFKASDEVDSPANAFRAVISPDFGGARPKTIRKFGANVKLVHPISTYQSESRTTGLDPEFLERHSVISNSNHSFFGRVNCDGSACWKDLPKEGAYDTNLSATYCSSRKNSESLNLSGKGLLLENNKLTSTCQRSLASEAFREKLSLQRDESWHFPPLPITAPSRQYQPTRFCDDKNSAQVYDPLFNCPESQVAYSMMVSLTNEVNSRSMSCVDSAVVSAGKTQSHLTVASDVPQDSVEDTFSSRFVRLKDAMIKYVTLLTSRGNIEQRLEPEPKSLQKVGIQEQSQGVEGNEQSASVSETNSNEQEAILQENNQDSTDPVEEVQNAPVQETPRPVCGHYQRRCLVSFPCCKKFYPCHRCHNDANDCTEDQARAINATHIRCTICYHEQEVRSYRHPA